MDFAAAITRAEFRRVFDEAPNVDAAPDRRTLEDVFGDRWLEVARTAYQEAKRAGNHFMARRWAHARAGTLIRSLEGGCMRK